MVGPWYRPLPKTIKKNFRSFVFILRWDFPPLESPFGKAILFSPSAIYREKIVRHALATDRLPHPLSFWKPWVQLVTLVCVIDKRNIFECRGGGLQNFNLKLFFLHSVPVFKPSSCSDELISVKTGLNVPEMHFPAI